MTSLHALQQLQSATGTEKAWAHGSLAELALLSSYHQSGPALKDAQAGDPREHCKAMVEICTVNKFPIQSTLRQLKRYHRYKLWQNDRWNDDVRESIAELKKGK